MTKFETIKLLEISSKILEIIDDRAFEEMPRGDLQAVIEAQIMSAYFLGQKSVKNELIPEVKALENFKEYTTEDDFFGRGFDHAKNEIVKLIIEKKI